jgi:hypothetical protein
MGAVDLSFWEDGVTCGSNVCIYVLGFLEKHGSLSSLRFKDWGSAVEIETLRSQPWFNVYNTHT